ncbi:hypothetical protein BZG17_29350 [Escherichia coli]|nr:hypothetical protein [Escherichia coli]
MLKALHRGQQASKFMTPAEQILTPPVVERLALPGLAALAEAQWTQGSLGGVVAFAGVLAPVARTPVLRGQCTQRLPREGFRLGPGGQLILAQRIRQVRRAS